MCKFEHTVQTPASKEVIWQLWTHASTWHKWDPFIQDANMHGPFASGSKGFITLKSNLSIPFVVTSVQDHKSITTKTKFVLCSIYFHQELKKRDGYTTISHSVKLTGPFKFFYWLAIKKQMLKFIPQGLENLANLASHKDT